MKNSVLISCVAFLVFLGASGWAYNNRQTRLQWDGRYQAAFSAYKRALEYVDAGTLLYEPRYLDLQKAADELDDTPRPHYGFIDSRTRDSMVAGIQSCQRTLGIYRDSAQLALRSDDARDFRTAQKALERQGAELHDIYNCAETGEPDYAYQKLDPLRKFAVDHASK